MNPHFIATRVLKLQENPQQQIEVQLAEPEQVSELEWRCAYRVPFQKTDPTYYAYGVDSFQALLMALTGIRAHLDAKKETFLWLSEEPGDHGFPKWIPQIFGVGFSQKLEQMVDAEVENFALQLEEFSAAFMEKPSK